MAMRKGKNEIAISLFLFFTVCGLLENIVLFFTTFSVITCFVGVIAVAIFWHNILGGMMRFDVLAPIPDFLCSVGIGLLVFAVSCGVAVGAEELLYHSLGNKGFFLHEIGNFTYTGLELATVSNMQKYPVLLLPWAGAIVSLVCALFGELLFRGLLLNAGLKSGDTFISTNVRQALMYAVFSVSYTYFVVIKQYMLHSNIKMILFSSCMLLMYTVCAFLFAFGLGIFCKATDTIWSGVAVAFLVDFFIKEVHTMPYLPIVLDRYVGLIRLSGIYFVVFLLSIPGIRQCIKREW